MNRFIICLVLSICIHVSHQACTPTGATPACPKVDGVTWKVQCGKCIGPGSAATSATAADAKCTEDESTAKIYDAWDHFCTGHNFEGYPGYEANHFYPTIADAALQAPNVKYWIKKQWFGGLGFAMGTYWMVWNQGSAGGPDWTAEANSQNELASNYKPFCQCP